MTPITTKIEPKAMDSEISTLILNTPGYGNDQYPGHELRVANEFIKQHPEYEKSRTEVYVSYVRVLTGLKQDGKFPAAAPAPNPAPQVPPSPPQQGADSKPVPVQAVDHFEQRPIIRGEEKSQIVGGEYFSKSLMRERGRRILRKMIEKGLPDGKLAPAPEGKKSPPPSSDGTGASVAKPDGEGTPPVPKPEGKKSQAPTPSPDGKGN